MTGFPRNTHEDLQTSPTVPPGRPVPDYRQTKTKAAIGDRTIRGRGRAGLCSILFHDQLSLINRETTALTWIGSTGGVLQPN